MAARSARGLDRWNGRVAQAVAKVPQLVRRARVEANALSIHEFRSRRWNYEHLVVLAQRCVGRVDAASSRGNHRCRTRGIVPNPSSWARVADVQEKIVRRASRARDVAAVAGGVVRAACTRKDAHTASVERQRGRLRGDGCVPSDVQTHFRSTHSREASACRSDKGSGTAVRGSDLSCSERIMEAGM